jgi:putative transposase
MSCYRFIAAHAAQHPVALACRVLGVSRSGSYAWRGRGASARARADAALSARITAIDAASRATDGSPRVHAELRASGERCGRRRVARLMRPAGVRGCQGQRRRVRTTPPDRQAPPVPDRVERTFAPAAVGASNRLWVADISSVTTLEGWLYLAVALDAFSRKVVGWAMADHRRTELVLTALEMAIRGRRPAAGLVHHSDSDNERAGFPRGSWLSKPRPARAPAPGCSRAA